MSKITDWFAPLVALWEWSPMITYLIAASVMVFIYLRWWPGWEVIKNCPRPFIIVPTLAIALVGVPVYGFHQFMMFLTKVPIAIECDHSPHTIVVPADGHIPLLSLNAIPKESGGSGLGMISTQAGKEFTWPSLGNVYRCHMTNHGSVTIFNIEMAVRVEFRKAIKDAGNPGQMNSGDISLVRDWSITIRKLEGDHGASFDFYIDNPSQQFVSVSLLPQITFHRSNSDAQEQSNLIQAPGLAMLFMP